MPNPNELARLQAEYEECLDDILHGLDQTKSTKERRLRDLRSLEKALGYKGSNYNSGGFGSEGNR